VRTLEFVVDPSGPGSDWLGKARAHEFLDVIGPLGKGFAYPKRLTNCLLVGECHGSASLYFLAQELIARHKRVDMIVGGESLERVFKPIEGKRLSQTIQIVTSDGSLGDRGWIAAEVLVDKPELAVVGVPRSIGVVTQGQVVGKPSHGRVRMLVVDRVRIVSRDGPNGGQGLGRPRVRVGDVSVGFVSIR